MSEPTTGARGEGGLSGFAVDRERAAVRKGEIRRNSRQFEDLSPDVPRTSEVCLAIEGVALAVV
ncbi:hypothetical protein ACWEQ3_51225 [Streptomyces mirabilis]